MSATAPSGDTVCVYCMDPVEPREDGRLAHEWCLERYGGSPPDDFMRGEDGYARHMAWRAGQ